MRKAYSYIRFSTPDQSKGDSFRRQSEFAVDYCRRKSLILDDSLKLHDLGVSAFKGANKTEGALKGFLEAVKSKRVAAGSVLIVESLDRLSRDVVRPTMNLFIALLDAGITIVTVNPEREYAPENQDYLAMLEPIVTFMRAHEESATKSKRVGESWQSRRRKAAESAAPMTTVGPKWLTQKGGKWEPIPERVRIVQSIFRWCREGLGTYAIAKKLNQQRTPNFGRGAKWNTAYVRLILTDRRALGEYQPKKLVAGKMQPEGKPIPSYFPVAVTEDDFYAAVNRIKSRRKRAGRGGASRENVLSGLVFNAADGSKMYINTDSRGGRFLDTTSPYYGKKAPKGRSFPYESLEAAVLATLVEVNPASLTGEAPDDDGPQVKLEALQGRLREVEETVEEASRQAAATGKVQVYGRMIELATEEKGRLEAEIEQMRVDAAKPSGETVAQLRTLIEVRESATGEERASVNRRLSAAIEDAVESVWVLIEPVTRNKKFCHVQVWFKNGQSQTQVISHPESALFGKLSEQPDYRDVDLRKWADSSATPSKPNRADRSS